MAAPLYLERFAHIANIYTSRCALNKCLPIPFTPALSIFVNRSRQSNNDNLNGQEGIRQMCTLLPRKALQSQFILQHCSGPLYLQSSGNLDILSQDKIITPWSALQYRHYGRKVKPKPPKITHFEYAGDLRTLPEMDRNALLSPYVDLEEGMDENIKKITSFEFASVTQQNKHLKQLVEDRIIELFGPDSELEQEIAMRTLRIRQMIPYCIMMRVDKGSKIWLLKTIFRRRRLLNQLRHIDYERFEWLLRELKIRYVIPRDREEFKGWKHNMREATKEETLMKQRKKLEEFKEKLQLEKEEFFQEKAKIVAQIEKDLESFGLDKDYLDSVQVKERFRKRPHKILSWDERVKLGMTGKIKDYYG